MLRLTFGFPSSGEETGGVMVLYEFANALSRLGHTVNFVHGPAWPTRIDSLDQLPEICTREAVRHVLVDSLDDPAIPDADVFFSADGPDRLGLPCIIVQGYGLLSPEWEEAAFRVRAPKICIASWLVDIGRSFGVDDAQLVYVPNGIDHTVFRESPADGDRPYDVVGLFHPHREKGWPDLLSCLTQLAAERPGLRGAVFARNRPKADLPPGIEFVHSPDHHRLATEVYGRTKVFVQASLREGFGLTPVEAMACGAALVTTDNGGSRDYALAGETARVVPPGDPAALAREVGALLDDDDERRRLARAGTRHVRNFDWDESARRLAAFLERYVADPTEFRRAPSESVEPA